VTSLYSFGGNTSGTGGIPTQIVGPLSGFGEISTETPTPTAQVDFIYNINTQVVRTYTYLAAASVAQSNGEAIISSGTNANGYARLFARRVIRYRPGQGSLIRMTARFSAGVENNRQLIGVYNVSSGYQFGYVGSDFGILHTSTAVAEIQALTVTGAPAAPGNVTVTLDGGPGVSVAVTASGNTAITAFQISQADYSQAAGGWDAMALGSVVYFVRRIAGPAGASTFSAGTTGTVAAFSTTTTGVNPTETFIAQSNWNQDRFNGSGPSGVTLDPTKGNVYAIQFQYLGYGDAFFSIENPNTGRFSVCHIIKNANTRTSTVLRNPAAYMTWESRNTGSTTSTSLVTASGSAFTEGIVVFLGPRLGSDTTKSVLATTLTPLITLRSTRVYQNQASSGQIRIDRISVSADGTKPVELRLYRNATLTSAQFSRVNASVSVADIDTAATAVSGGTLLYAFTVGKTDSTDQDIGNLDITLNAGDAITLTAYSANASDVTVSFSWVED
jgi:hypothetical protein